MLALRRFAGKIFLALPYSETLVILLTLPKLRRWAERHPAHEVCSTKHDLYARVNAQVGGGAISLLEFGVYRGDSLRQWAAINRHPDSRFVGFDTFTGLPERWNFGAGKRMEQGHFDTGGRPPEIADPRVSFVKGPFNRSLRPFLGDFSPSGRLVLHLDADLYSSTLFCLTTLDRHLVPGTILVFDEFNFVLHEFRALEDYCAAYGREYEVLARTPLHEQVALVVK